MFVDTVKPSAIMAAPAATRPERAENARELGDFGSMHPEVIRAVVLGFYRNAGAFGAYRANAI
jgi:hypothetical protein